FRTDAVPSAFGGRGRRTHRHLQGGRHAVALRLAGLALRQSALSLGGAARKAVCAKRSPTIKDFRGPCQHRPQSGDLCCAPPKKRETKKERLSTMLSLSSPFRLSTLRPLPSRAVAALGLLGALALSGCGGGGGGAGDPAWINVSAPGTTMQANRNYLATGAAQVSLTLPGTASAGSVIRVRGQDAGGWRIVQQAGHSIVQGSSWTARGFSQPWQG